MPVRQRLAFLALAALVAVVAVVLLAGGGSDDGGATPRPAAGSGPSSSGDSGSAATGTGEAGAGDEQQASPAAPPAATPVPVLRAGDVTRISVVEGERIRFAVRNRQPDEVHVHGYDIEREVAPGEPARFSFRATITGRFEIELHRSGEQIGELEVQPG